MKIRVVHLQEGLHEDHVKGPAADFGIENAEDFKSDIIVDLKIDKRGSDYYIKMDITSELQLVCDRCLDPYIFHIAEQTQVLFTPKQAFVESDAEAVRLIQDGQPDIDISADVREAILLGLPIKAICKEDCKGLCTCGQNLNHAECSCEKDVVDPRWAALLKLKQSE